ncbi:MAG: histidine--tRNA ligase [Gemmatimonadaceae bacterium]
MAKGALPGFRDFHPPELAERAYIMDTWRAVARRFAFQEYDGPPLEPLDLYTKKSGEEIVGQLYNFTDKGGREVSLRPEMTPTFARMVAERANALRKPVRWFSMPQLFRYERQQKGRLREHYQLNVDLVGEAGVTADAELVAVAIEMMRAFGLTHEDVRVRVSDRRILTSYLLASGVTEEQVPAAFTVIDKLERQPRDVSDEKLAAAGITAEARAKVLGIPQTALDDVGRALEAHAAAAHVADFRRFTGYVDALTGDGAQWLHFDLSIVRGLAYYTGIVFELFDARGEFRAIAGGGRYDNLLKALGGVDLPALGFGMGDVVLGEMLRARGLMRGAPRGPDLWLVAEEIIPLDEVMRVAGRLRAAGMSVEYPLRPQSASKQLKAADSAGARYAILLGPRYRDAQTITVRRLHQPEGAQDLAAALAATPTIDDVIAVVHATPAIFDSRTQAHG